MGSTSDLVKVDCLVWETEKPKYSFVSQSSSRFWLLGCEWDFQMRLCSDAYGQAIYDIILHNYMNINPPKSLTLTTYVHGETYYTWNASQGMKTNQTVWSCSANNIPTRSNGKVTVIFIFRSDQPLMLHLSKSKTDLSGDNEMLHDFEILSFDFRRLLEDDTFTDVKLRCGDRNISAHRSILSTRSVVFADMFRNKMAESETCTVDIKNMDYEVLDLLLKYVYSGKMPEVCEDTASSLYEAGDKYSIHALKESCSNWMVRNMTAENCLDYFVMAYVYSDPNFEKRVLDFVAENLESIKKEVWSEFEKVHAELAISVYRRRIAHILCKQA